MGDGVFVNLYRTVASALRSGDLHNCTQYDIILQGSARLMMKDLTQGKEYTMEYKPYEYIVIPARTPHIFEFLEETYMLEWWACDFKAWYFQPYRDIISASLQRVPEANETRSSLQLVAL